MDAHFTGPLDCRQIDAENWQLLAALTFIRGDDNDNEAITAPAGFVTDYASTPQCVWCLLPKSGEYDAAAVIHDFLYKTHCIQGQPIDRADADDVFREAMDSLGVSWWQAATMFRMVRWFGGSAWNKDATP